ncbi:hypothetical protein JXA05_01700 [Candidatus Peregrinibacteria bacterium]|nr:hypothetical protein [Candidatus Peregrinibacteria bacterium]
MLNKYKKELILILTFVVLGQAVFALCGKRYTTPKYENRIFATMGVRNDTADLKMLNEAAHYFGQTIIGWIKFPHFISNLMEETGLPAGSGLSAHMQERQNIVFIVVTPKPIQMGQLERTKHYIQSKLDNYNQDNKTGFLLSNVDYEQTEIRRPYAIGAAITFVLSVLLGVAVLFVRRELA